MCQRIILPPVLQRSHMKAKLKGSILYSTFYGTTVSRNSKVKKAFDVLAVSKTLPNVCYSLEICSIVWQCAQKACLKLYCESSSSHFNIINQLINYCLSEQRVPLYNA